MTVDAIGRRIAARPPRPRDPEPAKQLSDLLARRRRRGLPWDDDEFARLAAVVVQLQHPQDRVDWVAVFTDLQPIWQQAYERTWTFRHYLPG